MDSETIELLRRYVRQQEEFGYPPLIIAPGGGLPEGGDRPERGADAASAEAALAAFRDEVDGCDRCGLHQKRTKLVFGAGNPGAELMFVGEGPGGDEDRIGEPFVGRAGQLLDKILGAAGIDRAEVYITNIVKCRPPGNRDPEPEEIATCLPVLRRQIEIIDPKIICALGRHASQTLLGRIDSIGRMRGRWYDWEGRKLICTYHPSACLRNADYKRPVWEDFKLLREAYRAFRPR